MFPTMLITVAGVMMAVTLMLYVVALIPVVCAPLVALFVGIVRLVAFQSSSAR